MRSPINNGVRIIATGFVVLLLLSLPLFWARWDSEGRIGMMIPDECSEVSIKPSGLVPPELENDSKVVYHSQVSASMNPGEPLFLGFLGIVDYFAARRPYFERSNIYYYNKKDGAWLYFDERIGQIVCHYMGGERMPDKTVLPKKVRLYAGPEGISESPDRAVGRFIFPIVDVRATPRGALTLYDKKLRRFFTINFEKKTVVKGPELGKGDFHKPVQIRLLRKNASFLRLNWSGPQVRVAEKEEKKGYYARPELKSIVERNYTEDAQQYLLVLDRSGRIDLLDRETLKFAGTAGRLPDPQVLFGPAKSPTPKDLLAYEVLPLALTTDNKYRGMFVAAVSREGTSLALAVFDERGKLLDQEYSKFNKYRGPTYRGPQRIDVPSSKAALFEAPWAPVLTITKYLLENLHPPILSLVSYFTAYSFEAGAGHRAPFLLPNSFIAMEGRDTSGFFGTRFAFAVLLILPSLILAIFLAWRVEKDAILVGLSENAKLFWMIGTIVFGLTAYITYRLTRPKETLVTCVNCGRLRRPDMDRCHRCGSRWQIPELMPPTWRVTDT
jgi:hypothetical protein